MSEKRTRIKLWPIPTVFLSNTLVCHLMMYRLQHLLKQLDANDDVPPINVNPCTKNSSKYRYTLDGFADKILTKEQRDFYEEYGYIVIKNLLPQKDVDICNKRFDDIVANPNLRLNEMLVMRDVGLMNKSKPNLTKNRTSKGEVTKLQMFTNDPIFIKHYLEHPKILPYLKAFIGNDIRSWHHMYVLFIL